MRAGGPARCTLGAKAVDNGGLRYGAMESALRPPLPTANPALAGIQIQVSLDQRLGAKHHRRDPRKQTPGGRHQIGIPAGFKSESVAGFLLESVADIIGIRRGSVQAVLRAADGRAVPAAGTVFPHAHDRLFRGHRQRAGPLRGVARIRSRCAISNVERFPIIRGCRARALVCRTRRTRRCSAGC